MVRPPRRQLSALKLPCEKPTRSHSPIRYAMRFDERSSIASTSALLRGCPSSSLAPLAPCRSSGNSRKAA